MKAIIALLILINSAVVIAQTAEFSFDRKTKKYATIEEGDTLTGYFVYTNKGKEPLSISNYSVECHCTAVTYPTKPTLHGERDTVFFTFDSNGKSYQQKRSILLHANIKREIAIIYFKVYVNPKEEEKFQSVFK